MGFSHTLILVVSFLSHLSVCLSSSSPSRVHQLFETWCQQHNKTYSSSEEKLHRLRVFEENYAYVTDHNNNKNIRGSSYELALNALADLTLHEFRASYLGLSPVPSPLLRPGAPQLGAVPSSVDWREEGAVTNVKDQGGCGACWSFSATGAIEGINKIVTGSLVSLSEQELVDCDKYFNNGCRGGLMDYAFEFVINNHGIDTEEDYPYRGREGTCHKDKLRKHVVTIDGYVDVRAGNERHLLHAVATQPVSVGICGSARAFQLYSKGIFSGPCSTSLDHAVLIVGYGTENGVDYWIVKNSWGRHWGMNGYIHMARDTGDPEGLCGINMLASYPTKTSQNPPPPSPPGPTRCDFLTHCAEGETCCCTSRFFGICFSWKCCELYNAVCCNDHVHCCPHDHPICDTKRNLCLKSNGNKTLMGAPKTSSFEMSGSWSSLLRAWLQ